MSRLVGLPEWHALRAELKSRDPGIRAGQYVWNKYGQHGVDGGGWPELFYADEAKALDILASYYADSFSAVDKEI